MTLEKVLDTIQTYRRLFEKDGIRAEEWNHNSQPNSAKAILRHCHSMLPKMEEFVREGRMEKCFRWLGFVQGILWAMKKYKLAELKDHNKP